MSLMKNKYELPDWLRRSATEPGVDAAADEERAIAMLLELSPLIVACISSGLDNWLRRRSTAVASAWLGELSGEALGLIEAAVEQATRRVTDELEEFLLLDPAQQRSTPQSILRGCHVEPGQALSQMAVPEVERSEFEARNLPGDRWSLAPHEMHQLSADLGPLLLAWGLAKASVLRARASQSG